MANQPKSLDKIIKQGKIDKIKIDNRIKKAISKVGRADYQFLHSNCHVQKQTYSNGRIKSMIIEYKGHNLIIDPSKKKRTLMFDGHPMTNGERTFMNSNSRDSDDSNNQDNRGTTYSN